MSQLRGLQLIVRGSCLPSLCNTGLWMYISITSLLDEQGTLCLWVSWGHEGQALLYEAGKLHHCWPAAATARRFFARWLRSSSQRPECWLCSNIADGDSATWDLGQANNGSGRGHLSSYPWFIIGAKPLWNWLPIFLLPSYFLILFPTSSFILSPKKALVSPFSLIRPQWHMKIKAKIPRNQNLLTFSLRAGRTEPSKVPWKRENIFIPFFWK